MEQNQKNVLTGLVIVLVIAGLVGFSVWGMTHLTLGKKIGQLYQEKNTFEEMLKNKDKEKEEALEKTIAQFKSVLQEKEQKSADAKKISQCTEGSLSDIHSKVGSATIDSILNHPDIKNYQEKIEHMVWCNWEGVEIRLHPETFSFYGDFGNENYLVGFMSGDSGDRKVVVSKPFHYMEDPNNTGSSCAATGFIDGNLIYECGAGDGLSANSITYILYKDTGKSSVLKSCIYGYDQEAEKALVECDKNVLNLAL